MSVAQLANAQAIAIQRAEIVRRDGTPDLVGPGCYLTEGACIATAKEVADLRAQNSELRMTPSPTPTIVVALLIGIVVAGAGGYLTGRLLAPHN